MVPCLLLECLDSFLLGHTGLRHHQLDILGFDPGVIDLLPIIFVIIIVLLNVTGSDSLAFAVVVRVIVSGM